MAGYIVVVAGGKGGVGVSTVAANLAFAYAAEARQKVLLMDFDQAASGDQTFLTGLKGKRTLKDLAEFNGVVDPRTITPFLTIHPQNVAFIPMPSDHAVAQTIAADNLGKTLKAIVNIFPLTVIDVGAELNSLALKAMEFATVIFMVTNPDILAVHQTRHLQSELTTLLFPKDMLQVIINKYTKDNPVSPEVVGKQLGKPVFAMIPRDDQVCQTALGQNKAAYTIFKNAAFSKGMAELVRKIVQKNVFKTLAALNRPKDLAKTPETTANVHEGRTPWRDLKARIHRALVEEMDLKKVDDDDPKAKVILKEKTKKMVVDLLSKEDTRNVVHNREEMNQIVQEILDEALGLGPLEKLLADKSVSEIMVVGPYKIYYEQKGKIKLSDITFTNDRQVLNVIERIVAPIGRRIDEKTPYVDARLSDGSRVHAIIKPCAIDGSTVTIRKFPEHRLTYKDFINFGTLTEPMADFLRIAVEAKRNIVVSGGTGTGKTTLINILAGFIPANERIITVEDSAELSLPQEHVVRLETRPPALDGSGEISIRLLVKQTLRMRPDRIVVGECRGGEALDMLQAMGTGHDGSMTSVHANSPRECIARLETLCQYSEAGLTPKTIREMIASSVHLIIQSTRLEDGSRKITHITELSGMQGEVVTMQDIFIFKQEDIDKNGRVIGKFQPTGFIPRFIEVLERKGYNIPRNIFRAA